MSCTKCNETTTTNHICAPKPCDIVTVCDCPTKLQTKCVTFEGDDLPITGIKKNTIETTMWQQLDAWLGKMREDIIKTFNIVNIGLGAKIYKGVNLIGEKELKSITKTGSLITLTENTSDIAVGIDTTALTTFVTALSTTQKTYSAVNIGTGVSVLKDSTTLLNNTQFNLRKITKKDLGVGASVIASVQESTLGTEIEIGVKKIKTDTLLITDGTADILINQKKLKSTDGSVTITESIADIDFSVSGVVTPDGSETKVVGGTNTTITGVGTTLNPYVVNSITKINNGVTTTVFGNGSILTPFIVETTNPQKVITSNHVLSNLDNNYVLFINTSSDITITIPIGLADNFQCGFIQETAFETAFVSVIGVTLKNPIGFRIKGQKYNVFLEKKLATETYYLLGNTKI